MKRSVTLKENHEFRRLYNKGASAVSGSMVIYCRKNRMDHNRLGITVSVKLGHAVVRNRARRRLREVYRLNNTALRQGYDLVIVARGRTLTASWKELNDTSCGCAASWICWRRRNEAHPHCSDPVLPEGHFSLYVTLLQLHPYLLSVRLAGH